MKRKITIAIMAMASALISMAYADGFGTLVFKSITGESYSVDSQGLEVYFKDGNVTFNNDGRSIPVASLASMEFSDIPGSNTGVEGILSEADGPVAVFSIDGIKTGEFPSLSEACKNLKRGVHIVRLSNGESFKFVTK